MYWFCAFGVSNELTGAWTFFQDRNLAQRSGGIINEKGVNDFTHFISTVCQSNRSYPQVTCSTAPILTSKFPTFFLTQKHPPRSNS